MSTERRPAERFDPRAYCRDEVAIRGLATRAVPAVIRHWLSGREPVSPTVAQALSALLATSPEFWLNLDARYREGGSTR